ncbi:MAG: helix-turn-helix transcriptional regulator [Lachnospiraceae bacterium]|nr:helix-turn-helix transcriptional regulator [Lachnospiraceae bacterium]
MEKRVFGQRINYIRKSQKITSEQLAEMCDVNAGHIRQIESGIRLPSLNVFIEICNSLKISPEYLLENELKECKQYDSAYGKIIEKMDKLSPQQLDLLDSLLETYITKSGYVE